MRPITVLALAASVVLTALTIVEVGRTFADASAREQQRKDAERQNLDALRDNANSALNRADEVDERLDESLEGVLVTTRQGSATLAVAEQLARDATAELADHLRIEAAIAGELAAVRQLAAAARPEPAAAVGPPAQGATREASQSPAPGPTGAQNPEVAKATALAERLAKANARTEWARVRHEFLTSATRRCQTIVEELENITGRIMVRKQRSEQVRARIKALTLELDDLEESLNKARPKQ